MSEYNILQSFKAPLLALANSFHPLAVQCIIISLQVYPDRHLFVLTHASPSSSNAPASPSVLLIPVHPWIAYICRPFRYPLSPCHFHLNAGYCTRLCSASIYSAMSIEWGLFPLLPSLPLSVDVRMNQPGTRVLQISWFSFIFLLQHFITAANPVFLPIVHFYRTRTPLKATTVDPHLLACPILERQQS